VEDHGERLKNVYPDRYEHHKEARFILWLRIYRVATVKEWGAVVYRAGLG